MAKVVLLPEITRLGAHTRWLHGLFNQGYETKCKLSYWKVDKTKQLFNNDLWGVTMPITAFYSAENNVFVINKFSFTKILSCCPI